MAGRAGKTCIVLVEDNRLHQKLYTALLKANGFRPILVEPGDALDRAARPDVRAAIIDILLPDYDGRDIIRGIRADERTRAMSILAISASSEPEMEESCLRAGANLFRAKPIPLQLFVEDLKRLV